MKGIRIEGMTQVCTAVVILWKLQRNILGIASHKNVSKYFRKHTDKLLINQESDFDQVLMQRILGWRAEEMCDTLGIRGMHKKYICYELNFGPNFGMLATLRFNADLSLYLSYDMKWINIFGTAISEGTNDEAMYYSSSAVQRRFFINAYLDNKNLETINQFLTVGMERDDDIFLMASRWEVMAFCITANNLMVGNTKDAKCKVDMLDNNPMFARGLLDKKCRHKLPEELKNLPREVFQINYNCLITPLGVIQTINENSKLQDYSDGDLLIVTEVNEKPSLVHVTKAQYKEILNTYAHVYRAWDPLNNSVESKLPQGKLSNWGPLWPMFEDKLWSNMVNNPL